MSKTPSWLHTLGRLPFMIILSASLSACLHSTPVQSSAAQAPHAKAIQSFIFAPVSEKSIKEIQFSPDGAQVLIQTGSGVTILAAKTFAVQKTIHPSDSLSIMGSGFIDNDRFYIGYSAVGKEVVFKVYALDSGTELFSYDFDRNSFGTNVWANQNWVNYGSLLLNWRTGQLFETDSFTRSKQVHLTHDGHLIFPEVGWVRLENLITQHQVDWDAGDGNIVHFLMDTPDDKYLVTASMRGLCRVWKRADPPVMAGRCGEAFNSFFGKKKFAGFSSLPAQNRFAISPDTNVHAYQIDSATGQANLLIEIEAQTPVVATAISPREQLALSTEDGRIELWDLPSKRLIATYHPNAAEIMQLSKGVVHWTPELLAFAPDGKTLLIGIRRYLIALKVPEQTP